MRPLSDIPRVSAPHLDHIGTYITWGVDDSGPYCRGSFKGFNVRVSVSEHLENSPEARRYVEADVVRRLGNFSR